MSKIKYNPKKRSVEKFFSGLEKVKPFKLVSSGRSQFGYKGGFWRHSFKNLLPNTKYKVLIELTNNTIAGGGGTKEITYYDITKFCKPIRSSKKFNNKTKITDTPDNKRTTKKFWWADHFVTSDEGDLYLKVFKHSMFRNGIRRVTDWDRSWLEDWRENSKHNIIVVPSKEVIPGATETDPVTVNSPNPIVPVICQPPVIPGPSETTTQLIYPDYIQTFFLDPNIFNNSGTVDLSSISVYFASKPDRVNNRCGLNSPSITCAIVNVENDVPVIKEQYTSSISTVPYTSVIVTSDASTPTTFYFDDPVRLQTGKKYAFVLLFDDELFIPWTCKTGDRIIGTNTPSPGSTKEHRGEMFAFNSDFKDLRDNNFDQIFSRKDDTDLKFDIAFAEYIVDSNITLNITNKDEEFLTLSNITADFFNAETVYVNAANATGNVSITGGEEILTGDGTTFTALEEDEIIILIDNSDTTIVETVTIDQIVSDTEIRLSEPVENTISGNFIRTTTAEVENYFDGTKQIILTDSTANTTNYITTSSVLVGVDSGATASVVSLDNFPVSVFSCDMSLDLPTTYEVSGTYNFAQGTSGSYSLSTTNNELSLTKPNHIRNYQAKILSRSTEIAELSGVKSANISLTFSYNGPDNGFSFESPEIDLEHFTFSTSKWLISNTAVGEETNYGSALSKHISKPLSFAEGGSAEDIRVIYNAWRPETTDVLCYAKIINSEDPAEFDSKFWTLLEMKRGTGEFSAKDNPADYREYEFGFPDYPPSSDTLDGTVNTETENSNNIVLGVGTSFSTDIAENDIIKIYNPLFPDTNYGIFSVASVTNNTEIVLSDQVANVNITGTGLKIDKLSTPYTAFNNADNLNIVRYFGENGENYDTYSTVVIKTVLVADGYDLAPKVADYRVIGVSA